MNQLLLCFYFQPHFYLWYKDILFFIETYNILLPLKKQTKTQTLKTQKLERNDRQSPNRLHFVLPKAEKDNQSKENLLFTFTTFQDCKLNDIQYQNCTFFFQKINFFTIVSILRIEIRRKIHSYTVTYILYCNTNPACGYQGATLKGYQIIEVHMFITFTMCIFNSRTTIFFIIMSQKLRNIQMSVNESLAVFNFSDIF